MALVGSALVSLGLEAGGLMSGLSAATGALSRFGEGVSVTQGIGVAFAAVGVAAVGMGVASVKAAADFQSGLTSLVTGAGEGGQGRGISHEIGTVHVKRIRTSSSVARAGASRMRLER